MNIYGFMHVFQINNWKEIMESQIERLHKSKLWDSMGTLFIGLNGDEDLGYSYDKIEVLYHFDFPQLEQSLTLSFIRHFSQFNYCPVFYIHTKGVSHSGSKCQEDWRNLMEHFIIDRWELCLKELGCNDIVGTNWHRGEGYMNASSYKAGGIKVTPHFSGNFWWARSTYLRKLPPLYPLVSKYQCEFWIGCGNPKVAELWHSGIHHHRRTYAEFNYKNKKNVRYYT